MGGISPHYFDLRMERTRRVQARALYTSFTQTGSQDYYTQVAAVCDLSEDEAVAEKINTFLIM